MAAMALLIMLAGTEALAQPDKVGPQAVWKLPRDLYGQFAACGDRLDCLMGVMKQGKASPEAMAFTRRMKDNCYLEEFKKMGTVDLASVFFPGRANTNWAYFLVNGSPWQVSTEDIDKIDITKDPLYVSLSKRYKQIGCWAPAIFKEMQTLPDGGQRFVFAYTLIDGPHAGKRVGSAVAAFDFNRAGTFLGAKLLRLTEEIPQ
jgi:hypothetical protein